MRQLGKKKGIQDGTLIAFECPCDCTAVCNNGLNTCGACAGLSGFYSLQIVNQGRALNHGGSSVTGEARRAM